MSIDPHFLHDARLVLSGICLMLTVSMATAAIVVWLPDPPVPGFLHHASGPMNEMIAYSQSHRGRNHVVPDMITISVSR